MCRISQDLIIEILRRLPVGDLIRFRCVSKSFLSIINSPDFAKLHLNRSIQTKTHLKLILVENFRRLVCAADFYSNLKQAVKLSPDVTKIYGSCNGLLLLYDRDTELVALWNPFTRRYKKLSFPLVKVPNGCVYDCKGCGFGYDSASDDYKVVMIFAIKKENLHRDVTILFYQVWVFSLRSNSWRRTQDLPLPYNTPVLWNPSKGLLADGALHWLATINKVEKILTFDLKTELFHQVPHLVQLEGKYFSRSLEVFEGCLCMRLLDDRGNNVFYIRKNNDGVEFSWSLLFRFNKKRVNPLVYVKEEHDLLLIEDGMGVCRYDLQQNKSELIRIDGLPAEFSPLSFRQRAGFSSYLCWESLVSPGEDSEFI